MNTKVLLAFFFIFIFLLFLQPMGGDGDIRHHLNTSRYFLEHLRLPNVDEWTFTAHGKPLITHSWGGGVLYYLIFANFGPIGVSIFVALIAVLIFFLHYILLRSYNIPFPSALLTLFMTAAPLTIRFPNRPEIFKYPIIIAMLLIERQEKKYPRLVLLYPLLILLLANLYGASAFIALILLIFFTIKRFAERYFQKKLLFTPADRLFFLAIIASFASSLISPQPIKTLFYIAFIPAIAKVQGEWFGLLRLLRDAPIEYELIFQYRILIYLLFLFFLLILTTFSFKIVKKHLSLSLLALGIFAAFFAFRQVSLGIILATPLLAILLGSLQGLQKKIFFTVGFFLAAVSLVITVKINPPTLAPTDDYPSFSLIKFLQTAHLSGNAFTNSQMGALVSFFFPDILVYSDTRDDLYAGTNILTDAYETFGSERSVLPLLAKYQASFVIGDVSDGQSYEPIFNSSSWAIVFLHHNYFVAIPKKEAEEKKLETLDAIDPFLASGSKQGKEEQASLQYEKILSTYGKSYYNLFHYASSLLAKGDIDKAIETAKQIEIEGHPQSVLFAIDRDYFLAEAFLKKGDCKESKSSLDKVEGETKGKFIFTPERVLPSMVNKGYTSYYLFCQKDGAKARFYLNEYLSQPDVDAQDKAETAQYFRRQGL